MDNLKADEIRIGSHVIEVREITIEQVLEAWDSFSKSKEESILDVLSRLLKIVTSVDMAFVKKLKPSEIHKLIEAVKEKNSGFLKIADSLGAGDIVQEALKQFKDIVKKEVMKIFMEQKQS